jgi:hypothetical protein
MNQKHFPWNNDPKKATQEAVDFADQLIASEKHVWRDPARRVTTVEWK